MSGGPASERVIARRNAHESAPGAWDIPQSWTWTAVANVGDVGLGRQRSPINHSGPHMRPYVRAANVTWTGWDLSDVNEMNFDASDFAKFQLKYGDVVLNEGSGSAKEVGKSAIWRNEIAGCCFQNTLLRVQPKACTSEYLHAYFIQAARSGRFVSETQGVNIFHIGKDGLFRFAVPLPPLPEQRRIVAKLDALDARAKRARADLDRIPALVTRAKQAILAKAFDGTLTANWRGEAAANFKTCHFSDLIASPIRNGLSVKGSDAPPGIRALKLSALRGQIINLADVRYLNIGSDGAARFYLADEDILISRGNGTLRYVGTASMVRGLTEQTIFPDTAFRIRLNREKALPQWLCLIWNSPQTRSQIEAAAKTTAGIFKISQGDLQAIDILVPPVAEQSEIVRRIESAFQKIDRIAADAASASKLLGRLDQTILTKAFRGELVPQNPEDEPASILLERIRATTKTAPRKGRGRKV